MVNKKQLVIAIDIDNTLVTCVKFPTVSGFLPGAKKYVNKLYDAGDYIILWTCRTGPALEHAVKTLTDNGFKFHQVNEQHSALIKAWGSDPRKLSYDILICDKNLYLFGLPPWWMLYWMVRFVKWRYKNHALAYCKPEHFEP